MILQEFNVGPFAFCGGGLEGLFILYRNDRRQDRLDFGTAQGGQTPSGIKEYRELLDPGDPVPAKAGSRGDGLEGFLP
jgi:hypothetical protein